MKKIVIVGGGTLGHIYPILPVVRNLKDKYEFYFIGTKKGLERSLIENNNLFKEKYFLDMQGFKRKLSLYNLKTIQKFIKCYNAGKKILKKVKPSLIIGMGGYISGVIVCAGKRLKYKAIIHEQNSVLGLANKFVAKKVEAVLLNFPLDKKIKNKNTVLVGNPRQTEIYKNHHLKKEEKKYLLAVGGSRGSTVINETIIKCIPELRKIGYKVVLITGNSYYKHNQKSLEDLNERNITIIPFTNNLIDYLKKASVVISRSGATTLAEILGLRKIAILIPSPNVTNNHQEKNADFLSTNNCAFKINELQLQPQLLIKTINKLEANMDLRINYIANMKAHFNYEACDDFIKEMEKFL